MKAIDVSGMDLCDAPIPWNSSPFGHITVGSENRVFMIPVHAWLQARSQGWHNGSKVIWDASPRFLDDVEPELAKIIYPDTRPTEERHDAKPQPTALSACFPNGIPVLKPSRLLLSDDWSGALVRIRLPLRQLFTGETEYFGIQSERRRGRPQLLCRASYFQRRSPPRGAAKGTTCGATTEESLWALWTRDAVNIRFVCDGADIGWDPYVVWFDGSNVYCHTQSEYVLRTGKASRRLAALTAWAL
jgi:hypothetical protein